MQAGYFDLYSKGGKIRRLYIPKKLREETMVWLAQKNNKPWWTKSLHGNHRTSNVPAGKMPLTLAFSHAIMFIYFCFNNFLNIHNHGGTL